MQSRQKKKLGLALSGGAARGWAHVGVLQALSEAGIKIDFLAGTSIGALIGAFFVTGNLPVLREMAKSFNKRKALRFFDFAWSKEGFMGGRQVIKFIRSYCGDVALEDLPIPFAVVAVDLRTGEETVLRQGSLVEAVRASIAIPGLFAPVHREGSILIDGSMANPLPVKPVRDAGAEWVIGVDLNWDPPLANTEGTEKRQQTSDGKSRLPKKRGTFTGKYSAHRQGKVNWREIMVSSMIVLEKHLTRARLTTEPCDLLIRPAVGNISTFDFDRSEAGVKAGYEAAEKALKENSQTW